MATDEKVAPSESVIAAVLPPSTKTRRKPAIDAALASAIPAAVQQLHTAGFPGVATSLQHDHGIPQEATIQKTLADNPIHIVHWSKSDMATSFRVDAATKRSLYGALRGYRMARASHGTNSGAYYYEVLVLPPPKPSELLHSLPNNARLGHGLREQLEAAVHAEQQASTEASATATSSATTASTSKKRKLVESSSTVADSAAHPVVVSHVRLGWSMRTADLQAPVGYDTWSYGIRSVNGALVHESVRRDGWGGDSFGEGDVIGCYISLDGANASAEASSNTSNNNNTTSNNNNIRFFKNGECLGEVVLAKGKLDGGFAFQNITPGTYYPAVSTYMGAAVRANFGPYFIYPPKKRLGIQYKPLSSVRPAPEATTVAQQQAITNIVKLFKKTEHQTMMRKAMEYEAALQVQTYQDYLAAHVEEVRTQRQARSVPMTDLPPPPVAAAPAPAESVVKQEEAL